MNPFKRKYIADEPKLVACKECEHVVYKNSAQEVFVENYYSWSGYDSWYEYFCPEHKKPYSMVRVFRGNKYSFYTPQSEWKEINEDGTELEKPKQPKK